MTEAKITEDLKKFDSLPNEEQKAAAIRGLFDNFSIQVAMGICQNDLKLADDQIRKYLGVEHVSDYVNTKNEKKQQQLTRAAASDAKNAKV